MKLSFWKMSSLKTITFIEHKTRTVALLLKRETTELIINLHLHLYQKSPESDDDEMSVRVKSKVLYSDDEMSVRVRSMIWAWRVATIYECDYIL